MTDQDIARLLRQAKTIAVVGLSANPDRPSYTVSRYLQSQGYRIVPINPKLSEVLGEQAYPDLAAVPFHIDLVDVFRRSELVGPHIGEAIERDVATVWLQLGIHDSAAEARARDHGITVVTDRCIAVEHRRLLGARGYIPSHPADPADPVDPANPEIHRLVSGDQSPRTRGSIPSHPGINPLAPGDQSPG